MKITSKRTIGLALLSLTSSLSFAYQTVDKETEKHLSKDVEVIDVIGRKTLGRLRAELSESTIEVTNLFNQFVTDEDLKFTCKKTSVPGSRRKIKVCESNFEKRIRRELLTESILSSGATLSQASSIAALGTKQINEKRLEQQMIMTELSQSNPQFFAAIVRFNKSKEALHRNHERVYGKASRIRENAKRKSETKLGNDS